MYDNFLSKEECIKYIDIFNSGKPEQYRDTFILKIKDNLLLDHLKDEFKIDKLQTPDNLEIVQWPENSFMDPHYDKGDTLAFIINLNDDYVGGETIIDGLKVVPKIGRVVIFSNGRLKHSVNKVEKGNRYTLIGWYV
jgi:hypothetical protein